MGRKPTKTNKCKTVCSDHSFWLKPLRYSAYISRQFKVKFCPLKKTGSPDCPTFNNDGKYYTSAFILPSDKLQIQQNENIYRAEHLKKVASMDNSKPQLYLAKPKSKTNYCAVCNTCYQEYIDHIKSGKHKQHIKKSKFNDYINQLCQKYQDINQKQISDFNTSQCSQQQNVNGQIALPQLVSSASFSPKSQPFTAFQAGQQEIPYWMNHLVQNNLFPAPQTILLFQKLFPFINYLPMELFPPQTTLQRAKLECPIIINRNGLIDS